MAKLIKTQTEWEGITHDQLSVIEGDTPPTWSQDQKLEVIGKNQSKIDGAERVTGRAEYTYDVHLPGMLYASILHSPYPHATVKRIDISQANSLPGVRAILTYQNIPEIAWWNDTKILEKRLRFEGDEIAIIAADDVDIAEDALGLISVDYENLPFVLNTEEALLPDAPKVHASGNRVDGKPRTYNRGDVKHGFSESDIVVEETFQTQSALHNCLEPHGVVASWNGDELTIWESTQAICSVQDELADTFNLSRNKVRVICRYMGSGFGSKQYTGKWSIFAALLARQTRRPVQLMYDRHEENLATGNRAPTTQHLKIGTKKDGTLMAIELNASSAIGALGWRTLSIEGPAQLLYQCPNVRTEVQSVFTNTGPARSFRGPGYVEGNFPLESLIDDLATQLGIDPIELRMKNYAKDDQVSGRQYSAKNLDKCYEKGSDLIGWNRYSNIEQANGNKYRALGMASQVWGGGGGPPAYAWVRINQDGSVEIIAGSQDIGTGTKTVMAQIAAEELGINPNQITVSFGNTSEGPYDPVSWGSMSIPSVGPAVRQATIDARNQLRDISAGLLDVPVDKVEIREGKVYVQGEKSQRGKIGDITGEIGELTILGKGSREPNHPDLEVRTFGAQFADVEVDALTGEVRVLNMVTVHDVGRIMNPLGARSQAEGAVIQGIGYALTEGRVIDARTGKVLNANMEDYLLPTSLDFNDIGYDFVDIPDNVSNCLGAKGMGEPALIPTAPAIANAIAWATGIRVLSLPITRAKILEGLQKRNGRRVSVK